jgi:2,4-dienoyl-CoA reductase-like NADH-dependent reductase (Old Yellow Enzyme family)
MNERIRELLQETYTHFGHGKYRTDELVAEKFAELIVRECIDIVAAGGEFASRPKLVEKLQEHFGVEE